MKFEIKRYFLLASLILLTSLTAINSFCALKAPNSVDEANYRKLIILLAKKPNKGPVSVNTIDEVLKLTSQQIAEAFAKLNADEKSAIFIHIAEDCVDNTNQNTPWCAYVDLVTMLFKGVPGYQTIITELQKSRNLTDDIAITLTLKKIVKLIPNPKSKKCLEDKLGSKVNQMLKALEMRAKQNKANKDLCVVIQALEQRLKENLKKAS